MAWGERLLCYGDASVTLPRVIVGEEDPAFEVEGQPGWLAQDSRLRLYDERGPEGVGGSMPIHIDPASAPSLPNGVLLEVTGHFDDPAAAACTRTFVGQDADSLIREEPPVQRLRCRENFVVTAFRASP